ncbi:MAG: CheR family methyltransferase [Miltoncostaeaceae bacterium]
MATSDIRAGAADSSKQDEYEQFCAGIERLCGVALSHYRQGQMERRLRTFADRSGFSDLESYLEALERDPDALERFQDRMTINVSELFRNPERFEELERDIIPRLASTPQGRLRAWSAGCSYGAEAYTVAILLSESRQVTKFQIDATDIDKGVLERARAGRFSAQDLRHVGAERLRRWFGEEDDDGGRAADRSLASSIRFGELNLLGDRYPQKCDLILCRNVVIYFKDDAKDLIYRRFFEALRPGGLLFVGSTERVTGASEMGWEKAGTFFYQKPE